MIQEDYFNVIECIIKINDVYALFGVPVASGKNKKAAVFKKRYCILRSEACARAAVDPHNETNTCYLHLAPPPSITIPRWTSGVVFYILLQSYFRSIITLSFQLIMSIDNYLLAYHTTFNNI